MESMKFVYSLLHDDKVFYIGCTNDLEKRYVIHLDSAKKGTTQTAKRIKEILANGLFPEIRVIDYLPEWEAIVLEGTLILNFTKSGHDLTNHVFNRHFKDTQLKPPAIISRKDAVKIAKYKKELCLYQWGNRNKVYNKFFHPDDPFKR